MNFEIEATEDFDRNVKRLAKKYPSLKLDLLYLREQLLKNLQLGTPIGKGCYKIRLKITSKGKGKSGGARVITYVKITQTTIYLLLMYDKAEKENITDAELEMYLKQIEIV